MSGERAGDGSLSSLGRRLLMIPGTLAATTLVALMLPILLVVALILGGLRGQAGTWVRLVLFLFVYLFCESVGILASGVLWVRRLLPPRLGTGRWLALHYRLQLAWASALFESACRLFGLRLETVGETPPLGGPLLVFMRHASLVDTLLPAVVLTARHGLRLRYVLKRELLVDPCLDLVGNRLPNVFVRRDSVDSQREVAAVRLLAQNLGSMDGVLIYPEGTRFTPAKRERVLQRLAREGQTASHARALTLRRTLPPRPGGPLGLIEAAPQVDVLFLAHAGLEGLATVRDLLAGSVRGRTIRVHLRRVPASEIPTTPEARLVWLHEEWALLDAWVDAQLGGSPTPRARASGVGP